ncbi:MAG: SemiSWEET family transporter [Acidimicrobiales bacterium]
MADLGAMELAVGAAAVGLELVFAWPQAVDAVRSPDVSGVSTVTATLMVLVGLSWLAYGVGVADPMVIVANLVMLSATLVIAGALARRRALAWRATATVVAVWALAIAAATVVWGTTGPAVVGSIVGIGMGVPQAVHAVRSGSVAGVAISSYVLLALLQGTWLLYGVLVGDAVIVVPNVIALPVSLGVLGILVRGRATAPPPPRHRAGHFDMVES